MKRIILVHGWGGSPNTNFFPWLKENLEKNGFEVLALTMPNTFEPKIEIWIPYLNEQAGKIDENTYLIGHSMGCQTILRYLQDLPKNVKVGGVVLVAGFKKIKPSALESEDVAKIAKPWLETPINWEKIKSHTNKITAIFSDNDIYVSLENAEIFREKLNAKIIIEKNYGHFDGKEYPIILKEINNIINA